MAKKAKTPTKKVPAIKKAPKKKTVKKTNPTKKVASTKKISGFLFEPIPHPKFEQLVVFTKAPKWAKEVVGKRYLTPAFAEKMIATLCAEKLITSAEKTIDKQVKETIGEEVIATEVETVDVSDYDTE